MTGIIGHSGSGWGRGNWLMLAVVLSAVLVPTACVLWFMNAAMSNERLAVRQRLVEVYHRQLLDARDRLAAHWRSREDALGKAAVGPFPTREEVIKAMADPGRPVHPPATFSNVVLAGAADAVLVYEASGALAYPVATPGYLRADQQNGMHRAGREWLARAQAMVRAGRREEAARFLTSGNMPWQVLWSAQDESGRLVGPQGMMLALELAIAEKAGTSGRHPQGELEGVPATNAATSQGGALGLASGDVNIDGGRWHASAGRSMSDSDTSTHASNATARAAEAATATAKTTAATSQGGALGLLTATTTATTTTAAAADGDEVVHALTQQLHEFLENYQPRMPSAQRLFLMLRLRELTGIECSTLNAELMAARVLDGLSQPPREGLQYLGWADVWALRVGHFVGLYDATWVRGLLDQIRPDPDRLAGARAVWSDSPSPPTSEALIDWISLGDALPGWHLAVYLDDPSLMASAAARQSSVYLYTAAAGVSAMVVLGLAVATYLGRQMRLTRLKNDFIATVSHELKTPLASMRVLVDTLRQGRCRDAAQAGEYFELIARENQRLSRLIDNFLSFSRMERNRRAFAMEPADLGAIAAAAVETVRDRFSEPDRLEVDLAAHLPAVQADRDAMVTVVLNLLDNAWKYSPPPRRVRVRTWSAGGRVMVEVADAGLGLTRRSIRRIFGRFYQVDQSLSRRHGGCGLGLSIVKFILDAHGARIDVRSRPGKGSAFAVSLPAIDGAPVGDDAPAAGEAMRCSGARAEGGAGREAQAEADGQEAGNGR